MHLRRVLRNILSTWVGYAVTLLAGFLLAPFIIHRLGNAGYGIWILVTSLSGYFGMLDLGLRQSVGRYVSRDLGLRKYEEVNRTLANAMLMLGTGGLLAMGGTVILSLHFGLFQIDPQYASAARLALIIAGLNICISLPMCTFNTVLFSLERFDILTISTVSATAVRTSLVVLSLKHGGGVVALALITVLASIVEYGVNSIAACVLYKGLSIKLSYLDWERCRQLFGFGVFRFVWIVANQLIFYTDSVVIGIFLGSASIAIYAIAGSLINYGRNVVSLAADTMFPAANR